MIVRVTIYFPDGDYSDFSTDDDVDEGQLSKVIPMGEREVNLEFTDGDKMEFHNVTYKVHYEKEETDITL